MLPCLSSSETVEIATAHYDVSLLYLEEALQAFRSDCVLTVTVLLGVATEHAFLLLMDVIDKNPNHQTTFTSVRDECGTLCKIDRFNKIFEQEKNNLPKEIQEDLEIYLLAMLAIIRNFRTEAGYPTDRPIDRNQCYALLQLFPHCSRKLEQLIQYYS